MKDSRWESIMNTTVEEPWFKGAVRETGTAFEADMLAALALLGLDPDGPHAATVRWFIAFGSGVECARGPWSIIMRALAGPADFGEIAARFATEVGIDLPSAWLLGLEEQTRILEARRKP
jgi:hypothetical protein